MAENAVCGCNSAVPRCSVATSERLSNEAVATKLRRHRLGDAVDDSKEILLLKRRRFDTPNLHLAVDEVEIGSYAHRMRRRDGERIFVRLVLAKVVLKTRRRIGVLRLHVDHACHHDRVGTHCARGGNQRFGGELSRVAHGVEARLAARAGRAQRARDGVLELATDAAIRVDSDDEDFRQGRVESRVLIGLDDLVAGSSPCKKEPEQRKRVGGSANRARTWIRAICDLEPARRAAWIGRKAN